MADTPPDLYCSFCRRGADVVAKLVGGPGVYICDACVGLCIRVLDDQPIPPFPGFDALSDGDLLRTLRPAARAVDSAEAVLRDHVRSLRGRGVTWERIGGALGVTRQAAWERFSD